MIANSTRLTEEHQPRAFNSRNAILCAAANVFSEYGLKGSTVRQIAAESGVNNTLITYYFGTKEKLWIEVVGWLFDEELEGARKMANRRFDESGDHRAQFRQHLRNAFTYTPVEVVLAKIMTKEPSTGLAQSVKGEKLPLIFAQARRYFEMIHELGVATRLNGEQMFQVFSAMKYWWLTAAFEVEMATGEPPYTDEAAKRQGDLLFEMFTA